MRCMTDAERNVALLFMKTKSGSLGRLPDYFFISCCFVSKNVVYWSRKRCRRKEDIMAADNKRNGLIELFRFLCSLWVAYFHGFFPIHSDVFNGVIVPVDFFFIVAGYFFLKSIEAYRNKPFWEGVRFIFWGRTKRFIVPLIIAASSILLCNILVKMDLGFNWPLSFLWFFAAQFVYLSLFYLLLKHTKRMRTFNVACVVIILVCMSLFKLGIKPLDSPFRGPAMLALGMLVSQIPKIRLDLKHAKTAKALTVTLNAVGFAVTAAAFIYLAYLPGYAVWKIHTLCCIVFPLFIYFATALPVRGKFFDLLGEWSIFIYLAQCPILFHHYFVSRDTKDQFPWLCLCAVALFAINRAVNAMIRKRKVLQA